ncbi:MAG: intradiol ring-cleavage dioxygenase [Pseudomonadota bacterium]
MSVSRRLFFRMGPGAIASFALVTCGRPAAQSTLDSSQSSQTAPTGENGGLQSLSPTPACGDDPITPSQTAGPFFTPDSPERASLLDPGMAGTRIILSGQVLSISCEPVANALLDFWHTNDQGDYDNTGYTLRGHQFTDDQGRYRLETIVPGIYPGRTRHFHVKVQTPEKTLLTTQLYFPEEDLNERDGLFAPELLIVMNGDAAAEHSELQATFNFVV